MAANGQPASYLSQELSSAEEWQDLVAWDGEIFDPLFQGDISFTGNDEYPGSLSPGYHIPESVISDQPSYIPSAPVSVAGDGARSSLEGPSSLGHNFSWLSASPSFSTTATSPLVGRNAKGTRGSLKPFEYELSPLKTTLDSPVFETGEEVLLGSFNSSDSFHTASPYLFNPFVSNSPHAFNSLDVISSNVLSACGGWTDQPQIVEPIAEVEPEGAIPIPRSNPSDDQNSYAEGLQPDPNRARAITIPQPNHRASSYHPRSYASQHPPPILSISPDTRPRARSVALSRSISGRESRRLRNSLTTPSPNSNTFGWVSYQPNETNKLVPLGTDGSKGKRQRGRTKGLTLEQRRNAALMRVIGACSNCKKRKERCDPGIPCKSCLEHYKGDLVHNPCRDRLLSDLSDAFLSDRLGWHPTARPLESFFGTNRPDLYTQSSYMIPLKFGFGSPLYLPVHALQVYDTEALLHDHVVYAWPPTSPTGEQHTHAVLPAILTPEAEASLPETLHSHLSLLVTHHFRSFPLYCSQLRILREVYIYYRSLPTASPHSRLLHQALKLLVLVHIGGDLTLPSPASDPILATLVQNTMSHIPTTPSSSSDEDGDGSDNATFTPTPCFIRAQLGHIMPRLALMLMKDILSSLEQLFLNRECADWPLALAVTIVVLLTIESVHYHAAKLPYHDSFDGEDASTTGRRRRGEETDDAGVSTLLKFYAACFSGCHARLKPDWEGEVAQTSIYGTTTTGSGSGNIDPATGLKAEDKFVESVREAVRVASPGGYLVRKATGEREGGSMEWFFDRLVARLLVLKV